MAEIDAAISKLISELKKLQGGTTAEEPRATAGGSDALSAEQAERLNQAYDRINLSLSEQKDIQKIILEQRKQAIKIEEARDKLKKTIKEGTEEEQQIAEENLKLLKQQNQELEKQKELIREANSAAKDLADSFSNVFGGPDAVKIEDVFDPKKIAGVVTGLAKIAKAGKGMAFAKNLAAMSAEKFVGSIVRMSMQLADNEAKFMKATGANKAFARSVTNSYEEMRSFGATSEEVSATYQELFGNFTDFTMLNQQQRESLAETGVALSKLGISNADFAKSIQISTKAMGMSSEQAGQNMLNLEKFAENLGVAPQQLAADFAGAGDMLAKMGDQGTKAFKDLAIVAKTTGMQMQSIINLTNKFDTFEGAADQAGKLNAALGGNFVNAMDLMMATDPAERFGMIRDSILDAGLSFDDMSYYQKNFYKDSLGLSDVGELAALMSGDMDLVSGATQESAQSMIDAKKRAHEMATMQERLNVLLTQIIPIIEPVVELLIDMTEGMAENAETYAPIIQGMLGAISAFVIGKKAFEGFTSIFSESEGFFGTITGKIKEAIAARIGDAIAAKIQAEAQNKVNKANSGGSRGLSQLGQAASKGAKGLLAIGAAAFMIGAGIGLAAVGTAELAKAFMGLGDAAPYAAMGIGLLMIPFVAFFAAAAVIVYSGVGPGIAGVFLAMGAAALLLGAGIAVAAYGMSFLVKAFMDMDPIQILAISVAMLAFSASLYALAAAGAAATMGAPGLIVLTAAIVGMAYGLSLIEELITNVANAFVSFFDTIANPNTASNIKEIAEAIEAIPIRKNIEFATSMGALAAANTAAAALGTTQAVTKAIIGGNNQNNNAAAAPTPYEVTINVMLDRDKLATVVQEINGEQAKRAIQGTQ